MAQQEVGYGGRVEAEVAERPVGLDCPYRFMTRKIEFIGGGRYLFVVVKRIVAVGARICYLGRAVGVEEVVEIGADSAFFDAFGVDEAFANFKPNFSTEVEQLKLVQPNPVLPIEDISNTAAAKIFSDFCQNKFGFAPTFDQK